MENVLPAPPRNPQQSKLIPSLSSITLFLFFSLLLNHVLLILPSLE